jgi:hypothetical protein
MGRGSGRERKYTAQTQPLASVVTHWGGGGEIQGLVPALRLSSGAKSSYTISIGQNSATACLAVSLAVFLSYDTLLLGNL